MTTPHLGVLLTHPIQYYTPLFRELHQRDDIQLTVYYGHRPTPMELGVGFGREIGWGINLLDGYRYEFLENRSRHPSVSSESFGGCDTPGIAPIIARANFSAFLVFGWHSKSALQATLACWRTGTPVLVRGDSNLVANRNAVPKAILKWLILRALVPRYHAALPVGARSKEFFLHYGADSSRLMVVPHFVDNIHFARARNEVLRIATRSRLRIAETADVFLFVGKLVKRKEPLLLLEAMRSLTSTVQREQVHLIMVGDGELREECQDYARRYGLPVTFLGFLDQEELLEAYAASDMLVLPSSCLETWGLVVNEAMAAGLPAVVSDTVGCAPDLVLESNTGFVFRSGDPTSLRDKMARWLSMSDVERRTMKSAVSRHIEPFNARSAAELIAKIVRRGCKV